MHNPLRNLIDRKSEVALEAYNYIKRKYPNRTDDPQKCMRDMNYVLDAYILDLKHETVANTKYIASKYWHNGVRQISTYDVEVEVHNFIVDYISEKVFIPGKDHQHWFHLTRLRDVLINTIVHGINR